MPRRLGSALVFVAMFAVSCSSKSSTDSAPGIFCEMNDSSCECLRDAEHTANSVECSPTSAIAAATNATPVGGVCCASSDWPSSGTCQCAAIVCGTSGSTSDSACSCGPLEGGNPGGTPVSSCPSNSDGCVFFNKSISTALGGCTVGSTACSTPASTYTVVPSSTCGAISALCPSGQSAVTSCTTASSVGSSSSSSGSSGSPKCASGIGHCGDTSALDDCTCGAVCYRNSAAAGAGYACHLVCTSDADCTNVFASPATCQPLDADGTDGLKECR